MAAHCESTKKSDAILIVAIALLGAASAISTSVAGYFQQRADQSFACVDEIETKAQKTVKNLQSETNPDLAQQYLNNLNRETQRCNIG